MEEPLPPLTPDGIQLQWIKSVQTEDGWEVTYNFGQFDEWHALE